MKNFNFSSDIFISEEYDFDPSKLHHSDYIIKIAIIKKDYDKAFKRGIPRPKQDVKRL